MHLHPRAVVLVLERRPAAVRDQELREVGAGLGEHRRQRHEEAGRHPREPGGALRAGEDGDGGDVPEEERGAPDRLRIGAGHLPDRPEHATCGDPRAHLAPDDPRHDLALEGRRARRQRGEP